MEKRKQYSKSDRGKTREGYEIRECGTKEKHYMLGNGETGMQVRRLPTILSMLVTSFYNMADTFFVGKLDYPVHRQAVGIVFS